MLLWIIKCWINCRDGGRPTEWVNITEQLKGECLWTLHASFTVCHTAYSNLANTCVS